MPHTKSAEKRLRQNEKRQARNRAAKKAIRVQIKKFMAAVKDGNPDAVKTEFRVAVRNLDKAASKRVVHPNLAARKKSQLAKMIAAKK
jgi:small subunit ribosomal protein S20